MGVDIFFVLSGFLITGILLDAKQLSLGKYFSAFYAKRARRILPPYVLILIFVSILFGVSWMQHWYLYILLTNLLMPMQIPHPHAFDPLWSLAVEEQFYLVWPFAVYFLSERRLRYLAIGLMILAPILRGVCHFPNYRYVYTLTPFRMDLLCAGALLSLEWRNNRAGIERWGTRVGLAMGAIGAAGLLILAHEKLDTYSNGRTALVLVYECTLVASVGLMLYALAGKWVRWLCNKPLLYVGMVSYTLYLCHLAILDKLEPRFHGLALASIGAALTLIYASLSWYLMESPLLGRRKKRLEPVAVPSGT
jgi:peptidoglycan/LPS O-acetylase OafA/YrhL